MTTSLRALLASAVALAGAGAAAVAVWRLGAGPVLGAMVGAAAAVVAQVAWQRRGAVGHVAVEAGVLERLIEDGVEAVLVTDAAGRVRYANRACRDLVPVTIGAPLAAGLDGVARALGEIVRTSLDEPAQPAAGELAVAGTVPRRFDWRSEPTAAPGGAAAGRILRLVDRTLEQDLPALRSEFLSTVTHELRTPLTSVKGSLQLVLGKSGGLSTIDRELLSICLKNADRLIRLINNLLDISRLELGKVELAATTIDPRGLLEEAVAGLRGYATARGVDIDSGCEPDLPAVRGDHDRLIQVLTNVVSNAVKFSSAGARVVVRARLEDDHLAVAVSDRGPGISTADQARLFQRFQRFDRDPSAEAGTGLGLAISKAIIERHGGRIAVESREGAGSTFTVLLPVSDRRVPRAAALPTVLLVGGDTAEERLVREAGDARWELVRAARVTEAVSRMREARPAAILVGGELADLGPDEAAAVLAHATAGDGPPVLVLASVVGCDPGTALEAVRLDAERLRHAVEDALERAALTVGLAAS